MHRYRWPEHWVYVTVRDSREMETLMSVCPQWGLAVEHHDFWNNAIQAIDPHNLCAHFAWIAPAHNNSSSAAPQRLSPYCHFRDIFRCSCVACRINAPRTSHGLGNARRTTLSMRLGTVYLCKDHADARRIRYCGVCFIDCVTAPRVRNESLQTAKADYERASQSLAQARFHANNAPAHSAMHASALVEAARAAAEQAHTRMTRIDADSHASLGRGLGIEAGVTENEDETAFPGVSSVCRSCRGEWLWRYALLTAQAARDPVPLSAGLPVPPTGVPLVTFDAPTAALEAGVQLLRALGVNGTKPAFFWPDDAVVKGAVNAFVELGESTVNQVLVVAGERGWLRAQTRWAELMKQAMAAKRWGDAATNGGTVVQPGPDYTQRVLVPRDTRRRSLERGDERDGRYANNAANVAAYARAGYTTTNSADEYEAYDNEYDEEDSELDDEEFEDDEDEVAAALEMTVKEMALTDWARARVLDGAWLAPADVYYNLKVPGLEFPESAIRAVHPVSWSISPPASPPHTDTTSTSSSSALPTPTSDSAAPVLTPVSHPGPTAPPPPTYALAEAAHHAHIRQMRAVLLPALQNVVRRLVVECALDAAELEAASDGIPAPDAHAHPKLLDPAMRAAKMTLGEVVAQLREEEGVWFDGMDWSAKRLNAREQEATQVARERERDLRQQGSDDSAAGTPRTSDTSPVLSTSTLGTTPSPPPLGEQQRKEAERERGREREREVKPTIPVSPVLNPPRLLRPIPYIPETIVHLPQYSVEALRMVWREACEPLYHCRCSVCERAMAAQQGKNTTAAPAPPPARAPTPKDKDKERQEEKEREVDAAAPGDGPWVMDIPTEDDGTAGADSVIKLVEDDSGYDHRTHDPARLEGLTPQELYWLQTEEQEGPGAWERERKMAEELRTGKRKWHEGDVSSWLDDHEYEEEEEGADRDEEEGEGEGQGPFMLYPAPAAWVAGTGRKRSVDELEEGDANADAHASRGGTPPKRARTTEPLAEPASAVRRKHHE
ncbi:hypothetical protein K438DRAFT_1802973 [Mycena galopus ATCC 62051]|nr:hypothetical protein K438DRAFT_1802973 [Mycena galopus ATCC 62051]